MTVRGNNKFCNYISISHFNIAELAAVAPLCCWVLGWCWAVLGWCRETDKLYADWDAGHQLALHTGTRAGATLEILVKYSKYI